MYRNLYDTDCITWSPQGRIFQVEYAMEAVKQGVCVVGVRSNTHAVLCSLKRSVSKLAGYQQKLYKIDEHVGIAVSGLTADAKVLANTMRIECLEHKYVYDTTLPIGRLVSEIGDRAQVNTQRYSKRPFGVGLIVAGYDNSGAHLFETCPSGNYYEYYALALGARSQSAKTYLEKNFELFPSLNAEELVLYGVRALQASIAQDQELTIQNVAIAVIGKDSPYRELREEEVAEVLSKLPQAVVDTTMEVEE